MGPCRHTLLELLPSPWPQKPQEHNLVVITSPALNVPSGLLHLPVMQIPVLVFLLQLWDSSYKTGQLLCMCVCNSKELRGLLLNGHIWNHVIDFVHVRIIYVFLWGKVLELLSGSQRHHAWGWPKKFSPGWDPLDSKKGNLQELSCDNRASPGLSNKDGCPTWISQANKDGGYLTPKFNFPCALLKIPLFFHNSKRQCEKELHFTGKSSTFHSKL